MKKNVFVLFLMIIGTFLTGCASSPYQLSESFMNSNIPLSEHAVLSQSHVRIYTINGRVPPKDGLRDAKFGELYFADEFLLLPPGNHSFTVRLIIGDGNGNTFTSDKITISGKFEPGHIYRLVSLVNNCFGYWPEWGARAVTFAIVDETDPDVWSDQNRLGFRMDLMKVSVYSHYESPADQARSRTDIIKQLIKNGNEAIPFNFFTERRYN